MLEAVRGARLRRGGRGASARRPRRRRPTELVARRAAVFGTALAPLTYSRAAAPRARSRARGSRTSTAAATSTRTTTCRSSGTRIRGSRPRSPTRRGALNTNLRYLHPAAIELAERLVASMPEGSGSTRCSSSTPAARPPTSRGGSRPWPPATTGGLVTSHAYHGVTTATTRLSPEEWRGGWRPDHVEPFAPPRARRRRRRRASRRSSGSRARAPARGALPRHRLHERRRAGAGPRRARRGRRERRPRRRRARRRRRGPGRLRAHRRAPVVVRRGAGSSPTSSRSASRWATATRSPR